MSLQKTSSKYAEECLAYYSGKTSELIRQLALAGLAFTWLFFYKEKDGIKSLNPWVLVPILFFILSVACDFFHYHLGYKQYDNAFDKIEELLDADTDPNKSIDKKYDIDLDIDKVNSLYNLKRIFLLLGYLVLFVIMFYEIVYP